VIVAVDTNVLLRAGNPGAPEHAALVSALERRSMGGDEFVTFPACHAELWSVATRPVANNGLGFRPSAASAMIRELNAFVSLRFETERTYAIWLRLVEQHAVSGPAVHDARIVAAMLEHGIDRILTLNARDFGRYAPEGIHAEAP